MKLVNLQIFKKEGFNLLDGRIVLKRKLVKKSHPVSRKLKMKL